VLGAPRQSPVGAQPRRSKRSGVRNGMSARQRLSVLVGMMTAMANRDAALHPRRAAAALGVSRGALRRAGQDRSYSRAEIAELRSAGVVDRCARAAKGAAGAGTAGSGTLRFAGSR